MFRRFSAVSILCLLLFSFSHVAIAQVYPDREELDVVRLVDGTVLKGVILEEVPERYLEIQLYGGSTFVLGYGQIESVGREANPDYGTTWIKIDLGALTVPGGTNDTGLYPEAEGRRSIRSLRDGGLAFGLYLGAGPAWYGGPDWIHGLADDTDNGTPHNKSEFNVGIGVSARATRQPEILSGTIWMWGIRTALGYFWRDARATMSDSSGTGEVEYIAGSEIVNLPAEFLFGGAGDRLAIYGGIGPGIALIAGKPRYEVGYDAGDRDVEGDYDVDTGISLIFTTSLNAILRLGREWEVDFRIAYERLLIPWDSDREVYHNAVDFTLGIGYRFGGK
jgi:hypothetical protein